MEAMHFAFGVDKHFVPYAGILMTSIVMNHLGRPLCFHLAVTGLGEEDRQRLDAFTLLYRNTRIFIYDAAGALAALPEKLGKGAPKRLNRSVFLRILLARLLPENMERFIYLDADMLCIGSLEKLWQRDLQGAVLGAVAYPEAERRKNAARLGIVDGSYYNAGMMVIDAAAWRTRRLTPRVLALYGERREDFVLLEQDALNVLLAQEPGSIQELPSACNHMMNVFQADQAQPDTDDVLLHFVNEGKPWQHGCAEPIRSIWQRWKGLSLWCDLPEQEPWEVRSVYLAGCNAGARGDWQEAAKYLRQAAEALLRFYLEHTDQGRAFEPKK